MYIELLFHISKNQHFGRASNKYDIHNYRIYIKIYYTLIWTYTHIDKEQEKRQTNKHKQYLILRGKDL